MRGLSAPRRQTPTLVGIGDGEAESAPSKIAQKMGKNATNRLRTAFLIGRDVWVPAGFSLACPNHFATRVSCTTILMKAVSPADLEGGCLNKDRVRSVRSSFSSFMLAFLWVVQSGRQASRRVDWRSPSASRHERLRKSRMPRRPPAPRTCRASRPAPLRCATPQTGL